MSKVPYAKSALEYGAQVTLLQARGMTVDDQAEAEFYLRHLNYYRLRAYWIPFESDTVTHKFKPGTTFRRVLELYVFDRELRLLVLDALERLEVSVRTQWAYHLGHRHGPHAHLDPTLAYRRDRWDQNLQSLKTEVQRSDEIFIKHLTDKYSEDLPPVWAVCEVMSLGLLSRWYANLTPLGTRGAIAAAFGIDQQVLVSWLHFLTLVRNACAHHSRLWNREFPVAPKTPHRPTHLAVQFQPASGRTYNALLMLLHFMDHISPGHHWRRRLRALIDNHHIPMNDMGAPANWADQLLWQEVRL